MIGVDDCLETTMRTIPLKRFIARLIGPPHGAQPPIGQTKSAATVLEFDPFWHGDHWQNLLASPMDARHYVMEDWALPLEDDEVHDRSSYDKVSGARRLRRG
jgi:hypothetical protein